MENKLTAKQEKLCIEYLKCHNKSEAYRRAYNTKNMKDKTVNERACFEFGKSNIRARIAILEEDAAIRNDITVDRILQEYRKLAFTDLPGIVKFGKGSMTLEDFENLNESQRACIKSFKIKTVYQMNADGDPTPCEHVEVTLHDKEHALDMLLKYRGKIVDRKEVTGKDGADLMPQNITVTPPGLNE